MARGIHRLSELAVRRLKQPGRHGDGGGLYLSINLYGAKSWTFMWKRDGERRAMGLGPTHTVPLERAREIASLARLALLEGRDPRNVLAQVRAEGRTFGQVAVEYFDKHGSDWSPIHRRQWKQSVEQHAAKLRDVPVARIDDKAVLDVLDPLWMKHGETASRLRGRIERILDYAGAHGYRTGANPAKWSLLRFALPKRRPRWQQEHLAALPIDAMPEFMRKLRAVDGIPARALEFLILTAARAGEARGAQWSEIDLTTATWIIPKERMKARRLHRVPLPRRCVEIVNEMAEQRRSRFVFPGERDNRQFSDQMLRKVLRQITRASATVHGFRSTFRDWAAERTDHPAEVVEMALAHVISSEVERAYRRGDLIVKRRALMDAWSAFCSGPTERGKVVPIRA